jgi:hypothetical protein
MKVTLSVRKNRNRYELRFQSGGRELYVGSYASGEQAKSSGTGMIERGEAAELFTRRKK